MDGQRKKALLIRYGAYGDMIQTSTVFPYITGDGYDLVVNCGNRGAEILAHNPHVTDIMHYERDSIPINKLDAYWDEIGKPYDKVMKLSGTVIEGVLLFPSTNPMWYSSMDERRKIAGSHNYCERMVEQCGYAAKHPIRGEIYFTRFEREWAKRLVKRKFRKNYVMVWAHTGSSIHKSYAHWYVVIERLLAKWQDLIVITCGDEWCTMIDYMRHDRLLNTSGIWTFRQAMAILPYVDIVVGPETGLLNAAGCFDTPKICLLSHSNKTNLTKHWPNDFSMQIPCECSPCHKLFKYKQDVHDCPKGKDGYQLCMEALSPYDLIKCIEKVRETFHGYKKERVKDKISAETWQTSKEKGTRTA